MGQFRRLSASRGLLLKPGRPLRPRHERGLNFFQINRKVKDGVRNQAPRDWCGKRARLEGRKRQSFALYFEGDGRQDSAPRLGTFWFRRISWQMISLRIKRAIRSAALSTAFLAAPFISGQAQHFPATEVEDEAGIGDTSSGAISSKPATCANHLSEEPRARVFLPPHQPKSDRRRNPKTQHRIGEGRLTLSDDPTPTLQPETAVCTEQAAERYRSIASSGGWPEIPRPVSSGAAPGEIDRLRQRLSIEGDLQPENATSEGWDDALTAALRRFQFRAGLEQSGEVDWATLKALNVPADVRAGELEASAKRAGEVNIRFDEPHVLVNIPSASVEAIENSRAVQRHAAIVGKVDHPSPQLTATIQSITINPTWT